jgi:O-antigen/teichoic acid export membrane protein
MTDVRETKSQAGEPGDPASLPESGEHATITRHAALSVASVVATTFAALITAPMIWKAAGPTAYGVYLAATALSVIAVSIDLGLGIATAREVAASDGSDDIQQFVSSAFQARTAIAVLLSAGVFAGGLAFTRVPGMAVDSSALTWVLGLVALDAFFSQLASFLGYALIGARRYLFLNATATGTAIARVLAVIAAIRLGGDLVAIAAGQLAVTALSAAIPFVFARRVDHRIAFRHRFTWDVLRRHAPFAFRSQAIQAVSSAKWQSPVPLLSFLTNPATAAVFSIGQRIPAALIPLNWRAASVVFPAASEHHSAGQRDTLRDVFVIALRGTLLLVLPPAVALLWLADALLPVWIGSVEQTAVLVARLIVVVVVVDALAYGAFQILWAIGAVDVLIRTAGIGVLIQLALTIALVRFTGATAPALGLIAAVVVTTAVLLISASRRIAIPPVVVARNVAAFLPAVMAQALILGLLLSWRQPHSWWSLLGFSAASAAAFATTFLLAGANAEEKRLLRRLLRIG